ncbi:MAG: hypothetical protein KF726_28790 [Anaerolineae bacterium]|nr:hypothetical protein [Anaerolineae bacterium]
MKLLSVLLAGSLLLVASVVIAARALASSSPLIDLGFGWCADVPCFMTIVPGQTTWDEVQELTGASDARHRAYFSMTFRRERLMVSAGNPAGIENTGGPTSVGMTLDDPASKLGDVLLLYGVPCNAVLGTAGKAPTLTLIYPQIMFRASLRPESPISQAVLTQAGLTPMICNPKQSFGWRGFQSIRWLWLRQFVQT